MTQEIDRSVPQVHLHIGDRKLTSGSGGSHDRINPSTGQVDGQIPLAGEAEIDEAVRVAHEAFQTWKKTPPTERRRLLLKLADLIDERGPDLGRLSTIDTGMKYMPNAGLAAEWTRYFAGWADKLSSDVVGTVTANGEFSYTLGQPYGVIGAIVTWNGPTGGIAMKVPAALAAGNTVVIKPPEITPYSPELFMDLVREAGFPPGVINLLPGNAQAGAALVAHPLVQKVTFTGGPVTATRILESCAKTMKPAVLELGGKSANLIFEDADLDTACVHGAILSVGFLSGQGCSFPTRMLVHRSRYDEVIERVSAVAKSFVVGDPFDQQTLLGPVISQAAVDRVMGIIERAPAEGARLVLGGTRLGGDLAEGYFIEPTIFADVDPQSELAQGEVFGPVLAITPFDTEEEAVEIANSTPYGLAAYIHTKDLVRAHRVAEDLFAGDIMINGASNLYVNRPFGGFGLSGYGKEGGRRGLEEFLRVKGVGIGAKAGGDGGFL
ncbi:aldehyde dehydrogenase family protein [Streptomyces gilvus]|uniref:aldehyde dehydrogenase family protein n=1 Tax=Streptomyces gilvus TaxID=2920937 RepID=UPI001F1129B2|nr:aldehyde dehydrogenase family protein [Streptomyces sp. CME 23]MCH5675611.1 aldehyde dehydrogenase family protein [Streptomyces sp. CME 23]